MGRGQVRPSDSPRLGVEIRHRLGTLAMDVKFELRRPWTVLFGPSGSGKSTVLRVIAGLVRPDAGEVRWKPAAPLIRSSETASTVGSLGGSAWIPAHRRRIPLAPQTASLFPHRNVFDNVAYSFPQKSASRQKEIEAALGRFRIGGLAGKFPSELSGGEAQRVNLARAAVAAAKDGVLLLDEPFTGLDTDLRSDLMVDLQNWAAAQDLCVLSVTHDVAEAFQLAAEVIKIAEGKVVAQGPVEVVLAEERKRLLAHLGGAFPAYNERLGQ